MVKNHTRSGLFRYSRRRLVASAVAVLAGSCMFSPSALAASPATTDAPAGFWARALASVTRGASSDADPFPAGRIPSLAALGAKPAVPKPAAPKPAAASTKQPAKAESAGRPKQANETPPKRWITGSHYEQTTDVDVLRAQGCDAGRSHLNGLVILAFGKPAYNGHTYGTILFSNSFAGNHRITYAMKAFARGYMRCLPRDSNAKITLARGTSNYGISVPNTVNAGRRWARETMTLAKWQIGRAHV